MAVRRISKSSIDWAEFAKRVPEDQMSSFFQLKTKSSGYMRRVLQSPEKMPAIDWSHYSSRITNKAMVDHFRQKMEAVKIPFPQDTLSTQIDVKAKAAEKTIAEYVAASKERVTKHEVELSKWDHVPPFEQMTLEEYHIYFPELAPGPESVWPHDAETGGPAKSS